MMEESVVDLELKVSLAMELQELLV
jgi:hypothetical protein